MRRLEAPIQQMIWDVDYNGEADNPCINAVRFIPNQDMIMAGSSES